MHYGNVVTAWVLMTHDALVAEASGLETDLRELAALTLVASHPGCSIEWLRPRVSLTQSGTVRLIDRLADKGWIDRRRGGGREVALSVSRKGRRVLRCWHSKRDELLAGLFGELPVVAREHFIAALSHSLSSSNRQREEADRTCLTCNWQACGSDCPVDLSVADAD
jgi:DNA-binding MarR family transcriptional regulator